MSNEIVVDYTRCPNCSFVYEATLDRCPKCQQVTMIQEDQIDTRVFNICD